VLRSLTMATPAASSAARSRLQRWQTWPSDVQLRPEPLVVTQHSKDSNWQRSLTAYQMSSAVPSGNDQTQTDSRYWPLAKKLLGVSSAQVLGVAHPVG